MDRRIFTRLSIASLLCTPRRISAQQPQHVTIIGAGSTGLTAAYRLTKAGVQFQILEAANLIWDQDTRLPTPDLSILAAIS